MAEKTWIITEFFYPDENATGYLMTSLARGMRHVGAVGVVCRTSKLSKDKEEALHPSIDSPDVHRVWSTHYSKDTLGLRIINIITLSTSIFFSLIWNLRRGDVALVVTNPPALPYVTKCAAWLKQSACIVL
ncbi:MAG: hypothetical protein LUO89_03335, partial [Methanothrix sp.]|nr:hypothetical protein [Methanothrix sp.]